MQENLREKANALPLQPGVYLMMDKSGKIIYVGKAKQLKNRVSSYFRGDHDSKTQMMVSKIADFDVIIAASEFEALLLENSLIKHHMPKYNILLRDDKGFPFIRLDVQNDYPQFSIVARQSADGARYFGPYGGRVTTRNAIDAVCKALKLPTCKKKFPRDIGRFRPCLNLHMGTCRGYCRKDATSEEYRKSIDEAILILAGKTDVVIDKLTCEMEQAAEDYRFEVAAEKRDRIRAVSALHTKQHVIAGTFGDTDVIGFYRGEARSCFVVLHYIDGQLLDKEYELLSAPVESDSEAISGIVRQYYERRGSAPKYIYLPLEISDAELLERMFTENSGQRVYIQTPKRGEKKELVDNANLNAREEVERVTTRDEKTAKTIEWLQNALNMDTAPNRIEAFDISNTGSSDIVAAMTVFQNGKPLKKAYRKFKIKTVKNQDDYHSMAEVVSRRVSRYISGDAKFSPLPDLMLIDGGQTHAQAALNAIESLGIHLPVYGMVKDNRHRTRALISHEGYEVGIYAVPAVFAFIGTIQEETHRFAIEYHRSLRSKNSYKSGLDEIDGIGPGRRNSLLKAFGSIKSIKAATVEELSKVVPKKAAENIYRYFHGESGE